MNIGGGVDIELERSVGKVATFFVQGLDLSQKCCKGDMEKSSKNDPKRPPTWSPFGTQNPPKSFNLISSGHFKMLQDTTR